MTTIQESAKSARAASRIIAATSGATRNAALHAIAAGLRANIAPILEANAKDLDAGRERGLDAAFLDRLMLNEARIESMAIAVEEIAAQNDPIGLVEQEIVRPNGIRVARERIPLGVVAVIYEARPNVTSDAAALAIRSGNAVILKGGSDASFSNEAVGKVVSAAIAEAGLPAEAVHVLVTKDRSEITEMLKLDELIDVVIPRGGEGLIRFVTENSRIPVIKHFKGVCHVYVDKTVDFDMAREIVINAKIQRPSACNAVETILVHEDVAAAILPLIAEDLISRGSTLHGCERTQAILGDRVVPATDEDWAAEYLSLEVAIRVVPSLDEAILHIQRWNSDHTEAIVSNDIRATQEFRARIQSACVMVNASTRFADGGELGLGAEIGISTSRLHAYGPMGAEGLTTLRFVITGQGQVR